MPACEAIKTGASDPRHFSAHRCQEVRDVARSLNIVMHFIAAGATDTLQPLDHYAFGAMKASDGRIYRSRVAEEGLMKLSKRDFILHLLASCEAVNRTTLARAWEIHETQ
jgi:hypothetical protein